MDSPSLEERTAARKLTEEALSAVAPKQWDDYLRAAHACVVALQDYSTMVAAKVAARKGMPAPRWSDEEPDWSALDACMKVEGVGLAVKSEAPKEWAAYESALSAETAMRKRLDTAT